MASQSSIVYEQLKDMIFHMKLMPGQRISELQFASALHVSRTPVHDAVRLLAAERLVTLESNRSAVVADFTDEEIRHIGSIRLAQDLLCAQLASYYGSTADFDQLSALADACEKAAEQGDIYNRIQADGAFHLKIAEISGNSQLYEQQKALYQQIHLIQISRYTNITDSLQQIHLHRPILEAIRTQNNAEIRRLLCEHMKVFYHLDPYLLKCYSGEE